MVLAKKVNQWQNFVYCWKSLKVQKTVFFVWCGKTDCTCSGRKLKILCALICMLFLLKHTRNHLGANTDQSVVSFSLAFQQRWIYHNEGFWLKLLDNGQKAAKVKELLSVPTYQNEKKKKNKMLDLLEQTGKGWVCSWFRSLISASEGTSHMKVALSISIRLKVN